MISPILKKDRAALIRLAKTMTPEERLVAYLNHSRLLHQFHRAGKASRNRPKAARTAKPRRRVK